MIAGEHDVELIHALAFFYWRRNQTERAAALAYAAYRLGKKDAKLGCLLAITLLDLDLPEQSLLILDQIDAAGDDETAASLLAVRARAYLRLGETDLAREEFMKGLAIRRSMTAA